MKREKKLSEAENDAGLGEIVGRHFHFHLVADHEPDEALTHFPGDVGEHLMAACEFHPEHSSREDRGNLTLYLYSLILIVRTGLFSRAKASVAVATA